MTERFETFELAQNRCAALIAETGKEHVAYKTNFVFDKFAVAMLPQIGDSVSMSFNGDSYPCGEIVRITAKHNSVFTSTGHVFKRSSPMGWKEGSKNNSFSMILGVHDERNPSF